MGLHIDVVQSVSGWPVAVRRPGPVHRLHGQVFLDGFWLQWQPPRGGGPVAGYRVERTRDGRAYEPVLETRRPDCVLRDVEPGSPWFYRVTAFNVVAGAGRAREAILYQRRGPGFAEVIMVIPIVPGLRISLGELEMASAGPSTGSQPGRPQR